MPRYYYWDSKDEDVFGDIQKSKSSILNEIINLLTLNGKLPSTKLVSDNSNVAGSYDPRTDSLEFHRFTGNHPVTQAHELTHALRARMAGKASNWKHGPATPEQQQFSQAMYKMNPRNFITGDPYRDNYEEQAAFGVGNFVDVPSAQEYSIRPGLPHMDATNATDEAVLRELFSRALKSRK